MSNLQIMVLANGDARCLYSENVDLRSLGKLLIERGSHVEPTDGGQWIVDLAPVNGPVLGPFVHRSEGLDAEVNWLQRYWLPQSGQ